MSYAFTIEDEVDVDASPDDVWSAITLGPRIDSWFTGRNEVEPRTGGTARTDVGGFVLESTVTTWEPPRRLVYRGAEGPDGAFMEVDWRIDPRVGGGATVHFARSGRLAGVDGRTEYEALKKGDPMYVRKLARYLEFFNGRTAACNVAARGPDVDGARFRSTLRSALGLSATVREWDPVRVEVGGLGVIDGVVDYRTPEFLGVRTSTGLYRFIHAPG